MLMTVTSSGVACRAVAGGRGDMRSGRGGARRREPRPQAAAAMVAITPRAAGQRDIATANASMSWRPSSGRYGIGTTRGCGAWLAASFRSSAFRAPCRPASRITRA